MKKILSFVVISLLLSLFLMGCGQISETDKFIQEQEVKQQQISDNYNDPIKKIDQNSYQSTDQINIESKSSLEIVDGWKITKDRDYIYIKGRVKNTGEVNISYWKLTAEYLDENNNVLDTDYTNSLEIIRPDNQKEFEIMHKYDSEYNKYRVFIEEVK